MELHNDLLGEEVYLPQSFNPGSESEFEHEGIVIYRYHDPGANKFYLKEYRFIA